MTGMKRSHRKQVRRKIRKLDIAIFALFISLAFVTTMWVQKKNKENDPVLVSLQYTPAKEKRTQAVEMAKTALSEKTQRSVGDIKLISSYSRTFPDTSLGCPKPGRMYAQVLTPGFVIILSLEGTTYTYHVSAEKTVSC